MIVTIIPADGFVSIDGVGYNDIDLSSVPSNIHALQWYGDEGEIEIKDERGRITQNVVITSLDEYFKDVYEKWEKAHIQSQNLLSDAVVSDENI
jgi:hypothetical protein